MKIIVVGPVYPYRGGIAHFTTMLVIKLAAHHEVIPVTYSRQYPTSLYPGGSDRDTGPGRLKVDAQALLDPLNPFSWVKTAGELCDQKPDLVVLQWWVTLWAPAIRFLAGRLRRAQIPYVIIIHNALPHEPRRLDPMLVRYALAPGRDFIVMNQREQVILGGLVHPESRIRLCPLPVFCVFPRINLTSQQARKQLSLPVDRKLVLFFGIIRPYKGLKNLLEAVSLLKNSGRQDIHLVIAGEFWEDKQGYLDLIKKLGITRQVHIFDRFVSDQVTSLLFTAADLYAGPYQGGTQSATIKTAFSFGLPMVVTSIVSDEIIRQHPTYCRVIESAEPVLLAESIVEMIARPVMPAEEVDHLAEKSWQKMIGLLETGARK